MFVGRGSCGAGVESAAGALAGPACLFLSASGLHRGAQVAGEGSLETSGCTPRRGGPRISRASISTAPENSAEPGPCASAKCYRFRRPVPEGRELEWSPRRAPPRGQPHSTAERVFGMTLTAGWRPQLVHLPVGITKRRALLTSALRVQRVGAEGCPQEAKGCWSLNLENCGRSSVPDGKGEQQVQQEQLEQGSHDRSITPAFHLLSTEFRLGSCPKQDAALSPMGRGAVAGAEN